MPVISTPNGRSLSYEVGGAGEQLLCHPGGPGFSHAYLGDLGGLERFRTIVALDPRGAGDSDPADSPDAYGLDDYVADLGHLQEALGQDKIDLLGHSHGSLVAILYAATFPDRIGRLILVATGARFQEQQIEAMHAAMEQRRDEPWFEDASEALRDEQEGKFRDDHELGRLAARELPFYFARYGENERAFVQRALEQPVHAAALRHFNTHEFLTFDLRPAVARITAPTLVVAGQHDFILGPFACREVADGIANARLEILDDSGHMPWVESPQRFVAIIRTFLEA